MKRELTPLEQDALRIIRGGGPYHVVEIAVALRNSPQRWNVAGTHRMFLQLERECILYRNEDGTVDTTWTMEEVLQGWKEI